MRKMLPSLRVGLILVEPEDLVRYEKLKGFILDGIDRYKDFVKTADNEFLKIEDLKQLREKLNSGNTEPMEIEVYELTPVLNLYVDGRAGGSINAGFSSVRQTGKLVSIGLIVNGSTSGSGVLAKINGVDLPNFNTSGGIALGGGYSNDKSGRFYVEGGSDGGQIRVEGTASGNLSLAGCYINT